MSHMFGHALSKGTDIDQNKYRDLAVGAPNAEIVYVYKSYPIVKVIASITTSTKELGISDTSINMNVCWWFETKFVIQSNLSKYIYI